jgi:hypothetical protein
MKENTHKLPVDYIEATPEVRLVEIQQGANINGGDRRPVVKRGRWQSEDDGMWASDRIARPELNVLGWESRTIRLGARRIVKI